MFRTQMGLPASFGIATGIFFILFNILHEAGAEERVLAVPCCFQLSLLAVYQLQPSTQQVFECGGKPLKDDASTKLGFVSHDLRGASLLQLYLGFYWGKCGLGSHPFRFQTGQTNHTASSK